MVDPLDLVATREMEVVYLELAVRVRASDLFCMKKSSILGVSLFMDALA
jgi:hypothetical protein